MQRRPCPARKLNLMSVRVLCVGDVVGYGASPNQTVEMLRQLRPLVAIRGNHDKVCSGIENGEMFNRVALQAALWHVVPDCGETRQHGAGFTPHLSVGQVQGRDALQALLSDLQDAWTRVQFQVSEASLIWRNDPPDDVFRVGRTIPLGH